MIGEGAFDTDVEDDGNPINENLVAVIAPNVTSIGNFAFYFNVSLTSVDFPNVATIGNIAFRGCSSLVSLDLPLVTTIGNWAFLDIMGLKSVKLGTGFETETEIKFYSWVFREYETENIDLILGSKVLPPPNLTNITWQTISGFSGGTPYVWKSIDYTSILETVKNLQVSIFPNPTSNSATVSFDLETAGNLTVTLTNILGQELFEIYSGFANAGIFTQTFSMEALPIGVYYLKISHNGNVAVEKVVRE